MKPIISILLILHVLHAFAIKTQPVFFIENYWRHYTYHYQKHSTDIQQTTVSTIKPHLIFYGSETSLLQQKLLFHEIGVPHFVTASASNEVDVSQYLKWIIFAKENPKRMFPDIIRRPISYVPNFITESFYRFGISVPLN